MKSLFIFLFLIIYSSICIGQTPMKIAVAGLSHGHVDWIFNRENKSDIKIVGIFETNPTLVDRYIKRYQLDSTLFFNDLTEMLDQTKPQAVSAFGAISEHIDIVRACAPKNIHVMVEKPLATTLADAKEIQELAEKHSIEVLTNFETSWYASNQHVNQLLENGDLGIIRKVMVNDGHQGPKEIGVSKEFLEILIDPEKNGAGALMDFGCYGANLMTWLLKGERPLSVTAVVNQNKPGIYNRVDDEASIILQYRGAQCIIQASWNWPFARKDLEVYGDKGYAMAIDAQTVRERLSERSPESTQKLDPRPAPFTDPFSLLAKVVEGSLNPSQYELYSLPINVTVVEILEAAMRSAGEKKTIFLD